MRPDFPAAAPHWPTGMHTITNRRLSTAAGVGVDDLTAKAEFHDAPAGLAERAVATMLRRVSCARAARAMEDPIRPTRSARGV